MGNPAVITDSTPTKVVFRKWKDDGTLIALFPEVPFDIHGYECMSYQRVGQHGPAGYANTIKHSKPVLWWDQHVLDLVKELEGRGYKLDTCQRATEAMHHARYAEADRLRKQLEEESAKQPDYVAKHGLDYDD